MSQEPKAPTLARLTAAAFWLGILGFGGGYVIGQRIRIAFVEQRKWLSDDDFVEMLAVAGSLPGTTAANLVTLVSCRLGGAVAATLATAAFLTPSALLMLAFGITYANLRDVSAVAAMLDGMSAATAGVVAAVAVDLRKDAVRDAFGWVVGLASLALLVAQVLSLWQVVLLAGVIGAFYRRPAPVDKGDLVLWAPAIAPLAPAWGAFFFVFAHIGLTTFGGGVAMITPLEREVVQVHQWLSPHAFNDAVVLGQITPGPIAICSTFIGYRVAGFFGAAVATLGIFGPPLLVSIGVSHSMARFRSNPLVKGFLSGVAPAVVAAIAAAGFALVRSSVHSWLAGVLCAASFVLLVVRPKLSPLWPIFAGGVIVVLLRMRG